jgi:hypothetical protein
MQDDIIPLQEAIALKSGQVVSEVKIRKGQYVRISASPTIFPWSAECFAESGLHSHRRSELVAPVLGTRCSGVQGSHAFETIL